VSAHGLPVSTPPRLSSGPAAKPPGWHEALAECAGLAGRSHHAAPVHALLHEVHDGLREALQLPREFHVALVPGSASGAVEAAMWSLLGPRAVDVVAYETFGRRWHHIAHERLGLPDVRLLDAGWAQVPPLDGPQGLRRNADSVLVVNGTVAGACMPSLEAIPVDRQGLVIADIASAAFCMSLDWSRIDAGCLSFQKALGAEPQYGAVLVGPRAVERLRAGPWRAVPRLLDLRMLQSERNVSGYSTPVGTPSALAMADLLHSLRWFARRGGLSFGIEHTAGNRRTISEWVQGSPVLDFAVPEATRSPTPVCLVLRPGVGPQDPAEARAFCNRAAERVEQSGAGVDLRAYAGAPPGFRLWCGPTVERSWLPRALAALEESILRLHQEDHDTTHR
jgi:phosphoserine aminotransferase